VIHDLNSHSLSVRGAYEKPAHAFPQGTMRNPPKNIRTTARPKAGSRERLIHKKIKIIHNFQL
jgi:hypothetical protein